MLRRVAAVVLVGLLAVLAGPAPSACACSCAPLTEQEHLERAAFVFDGDVRSIATLEPEARGDFPLSVRLVVRTVHKGDLVGAGGHILVGNSGNEASCGYTFEPGKRYRVYVTQQGPRYVTSLCAGNQELGPATTGDPAWLEEPASPAVGTLPRDDRTSAITLTLLVAGAAGVVAVVIGGLRRRRSARAGGG
ncbi:hypothetical protein ABZS66_09980 [Dactylosporangium sp. NPDC005572]|uniref:hypothetical protein n=1 Tax=Dactylosporangium sp. NPDC005572 TaxID=3156889 RepID=UPI0033BD0AF8